MNPGDEIIVGNQGQIVATVASDTSLTTNFPFLPAANNSSFQIQRPITRLDNADGTTALIANSQGDFGIGTAIPRHRLMLRIQSVLSTRRALMLSDENGSQAMLVPTGLGVLGGYAHVRYQLLRSVAVAVKIQWRL